tara:strand:+ start:5518 stop:6666 length:1149 start_codon:yes stop_codon:yes gene_type:complete
MPPKKERKIKPPDDPTIMVGGQPKIDVNATKLQINEFLKLHKVIKPSEGGKRKSLAKLREELKAGGHVVGVEGKSSTVAKGNTLSKLQRAEKTKKEAEYKQLIASNPQGFNVKNTINILGFKSNPIPPKPSAAEIELSGYGGIPINYSPPASTVSSAPDVSKGVKVGEMRIYLSGRIPNTAFKDLNKRDLRELYNEVKAEEANETSSEEEEDDGDRKFGDDAEDEVTVGGKRYEKFTWDGDDYWGQGDEDIYDRPGGKKIGFWDPEDKIVILEEETSSEEEEEEEEEEVVEDEQEEVLGKSLKDWSFQGIKYYLDENYTDERTPTGGTKKVKQIYRNKYDTKPLGYLVENSKYAPPGETVSIVWQTLDLKFEHEDKVRQLKK